MKKTALLLLSLSACGRPQQTEPPEVMLDAGQTYTVRPDSRDSNGLGAFVIVGHYR